jgi:[acyl-carrier-protein] S-malonyltransferase
MVDFANTAFVFPGQGSQQVGMGKDLAAAYPVAQETFQQADEIMGFALSEIMFDGPDDVLGDTANTQPALYVHSIALLRCLKREIPDAMPKFSAGHSLGEFTALTAAGSLSFEAGLKLVKKRGELMRNAGESNPGSMAALLGITLEKAQALCQKAGSDEKPLVIANDNCPGQVVISGDSDALQTALDVAKEYGAKRIIPLDVSVATHSPLMQPAREEFTERVRATDFHTPTIHVYGNVSARPLTTVADIRAELDAQLTSTVRWNDSVQNMIEAGAETFVEIGSGKVLTGLLRRINRDKTGVTIHDVTTLTAFVEANTE